MHKLVEPQVLSDSFHQLHRFHVILTWIDEQGVIKTRIGGMFASVQTASRTAVHLDNQLRSRADDPPVNIIVRNTLNGRENTIEECKLLATLRADLVTTVIGRKSGNRICVS